jgi:nicotinate-nucleotide adenylyltransferase
MRIAFFGGSFDPPHRGHLAIARAALERLHLDRVLFAPVGSQPLKHADSTAATSSYEDRCAMVELAIASNPAITVSTMTEPTMTLSLIDAPKPNGEPNYTIDTLHQLKATLAPDDELFCLIGADSFLTLRQWRSATELLLTCNFIVAARPGFTLTDLSAALPDTLAANLTRIQPDEPATPYQRFQAEEPLGPDKSARHANIYLLPDLDEDISATQIRAALATSKLPLTPSEATTDPTIPPAVSAYIRSHNLYSEPRP